MKPGVLLVEGKRTDISSFEAGLTKKGYTVHVVQSGNAAVAHLKENAPHLVVINAASMRTSGHRICQSVRRVTQIPIVLIVEKEPDHSDRMDANVVLTLPFTLQKLVNRMRPFIPNEQKEVVQAGQLLLDLENHCVRYQEKQVRLTPRLTALLKALMERAGEVVERKDLFRLVWDTSYTEDMRTLDVHISWLRQQVEEDPKHPKFIKTVRGIGYRLDA